MALTLTLNGTQRRFEELSLGSSLISLVEALGLNGDRVALERNGEIAPRASWANQTLSEDDKIELVHFVGGGADLSSVR